MIQVLNVTILNETGTQALFEYKPDFNAANDMLLEKYIQHEKMKWSNTLDMNVRIDVHRRQRPSNGVGAVNIAEIIMKEMDVEQSKFFSKSRRSEVVLCRVVVFAICKEADFTPTEITKQLNFDRVMYYHYTKSHNNYRATDKDYVRRYEAIKDITMNKLYTKK